MTATPDQPRYLRRHLVVMLSITTLATLLTLAGVVLTERYLAQSLHWHDRWAIFCYAFVAAWWVVYFTSIATRLPTLRLFLRQGWLSPAVEENTDFSSLCDALNTKCASQIETQGIYIAVVSLLLAFVVQFEEVTPFQEILGRMAIVVAIVAILILVLSSDMLDTASNRFRSHLNAVPTDSAGSLPGHPGAASKVDRDIWFLKRKFYNGIRPPGLGGGISYIGFAFFTFFIIVAISLIWWPLSGIAVGVFGYIGYPYWFGYQKLVTENESGVDVCHDEETWWPPVLILLVFVVTTGLLGLI